MTRRILLTLLTTGAVSLGVGCTDDQDSMLLIRAATVPSGNQGICSADAAGALLPQGTLDTSLTDTYIAYPVIEHVGSPSGSVGASGQANGGGGLPGVFTGTNVEGNTVIIQEATISYEFISGSGSLSSVTVPTSGSIKPGDNGTIAVSLLNSEQAAGLADGTLVVASIQLAGVTTSGWAVTSNTFRFPVEVCSGCLDRRATAGCEVNTNVCLPGQDVPVTCQTD